MRPNLPTEDQLKEQEKMIDEWKQRLAEQYPIEYKYIEETFLNNNISKDVEQIDRILALFKRYIFMKGNHQYTIDDGIINANNIYVDYYNEISKETTDFIDDLIQLFNLDLINIFIPKPNQQELSISNYINGKFKDDFYFYTFIENLCAIFHSIKNGKIKVQACIYFTALGDKYQQENIPYYLVQSI